MLKRDGRLDDARRRGEKVQRGQRERDAVRHGEGTHDEEQSAHRSAEKQEANKEKDVIRADENVVNVERNEFLHYGEHALPAANEIFEVMVIVVEDRLRGKLVAFVEIHESVVRRT